MTVLNAKLLFDRICCESYEELEEVYSPLIDWLRNHTRNKYEMFGLYDPAEQFWIGYSIDFEQEEDAVFFKMRWG